MADTGLVTPENFERLLNWLDTDTQAATEKYENIRRRLIFVFDCRGCRESDVLADRTFDRVTTKISEVASGYVGDPALYFYSVGQYIFREWIRSQQQMRSATAEPGPEPGSLVSEEPSREQLCLRDCLAALSDDRRAMIIEYYEDERSRRSRGRAKLAEKLGLTATALYIRVSRLRTSLERCVSKCVKASN